MMQTNLEHTIELVNGSRINCFLRENPLECVPAEKHSALVKSEAHRQLRRKEVKAQREQQHLAEEECLNFFVKHAFFLLENAERICSDSRMFLAPVGVESGLSLSGAAPTPTLGAFIEWWKNGKGGSITNEKGEHFLVCKLAGSPFNGTNVCTVANSKGHVSQISILGFIDVYRSFVRFCKRYSYAKQIYQAYSLRQVVDLLMADEKC
ncbi:MAG: hypothetical protein MJZ02_08195 [Paludibacteraceae bacterium]|nr:hypothetical protein [Paludibacteraceae bacterium]